MYDTKREFQKVIGKIRADVRVEDELPRTEYPKAMMTGQQIEKMTATVNCGGEWVSASRSRQVARRVIRDERFQQFLQESNGKAEIEQFYVGSCLAFQVRIHFSEWRK